MTKTTAPITAIDRLARIRKIAESIQVTEGSEIWSLLSVIAGACDEATLEIERTVAAKPTVPLPL